MDDLAHGTRNKRGDWAPKEPAGAPLFVFPPQPLKLLKWLPDYLLPYNVLFALSALVWWQWVLPDVESMKILAWGWIIRLFVINAVAVFAFFGLFELRLYALRAQGNRFKYNGKWPSDNKSKVFWFKSQNIDNMLRTIAMALPIWTAIEVAILFSFANGYVPWLTFGDYPFYLCALALAVPIIHEAHFFMLHRAIHWPLRACARHHSSCVTLPLRFNLPQPGVSIIRAAPHGHIGFDKIEVGSETGVDTQAYIHYLHHRYFEVNYGDGLIPFDKWFGTFHDGSKEADLLMEARLERKRERLNTG